MLSITLYGFGSFFCAGNIVRDIDLIILHDDFSRASCTLAMNCKQYLAKSIDDVHVTILSKSEEKHFDFVKDAKAQQIGIVRDGFIESDVDCIFRALGLID